MDSHNDAHIRFFTRILRHLTNDPHLQATIEWSSYLYCYNIHVSTSDNTYSFTLVGDGSARQWPPPISLLDEAIARFCEICPELLI